MTSVPAPRPRFTAAIPAAAAPLAARPAMPLFCPPPLISVRRRPTRYRASPFPRQRRPDAAFVLGDTRTPRRPSARQPSSPTSAASRTSAAETQPAPATRSPPAPAAAPLATGPRCALACPRPVPVAAIHSKPRAATWTIAPRLGPAPHHVVRDGMTLLGLRDRTAAGTRTGRASILASRRGGWGRERCEQARRLGPNPLSSATSDDLAWRPVDSRARSRGRSRPPGQILVRLAPCFSNQQPRRSPGRTSSSPPRSGLTNCKSGSVRPPPPGP